MVKGSYESPVSEAAPLVVIPVLSSKFEGVNSRKVAGLKTVDEASPSGAAAGVAEPAPLGVKTAALAACEENVDFFDGPPSAFALGDAADDSPAGVNDGESTLSTFLAKSD